MKYLKLLYTFLIQFLSFGFLSIFISLVVTLFFSNSPFIFDNRDYYILDKITIYFFLFYLPYLVSFYILKWMPTKVKWLFPCTTFYTLEASYLFCNELWPARGMEVEPNIFYFFILFTPLILLILYFIFETIIKRIQGGVKNSENSS